MITFKKSTDPNSLDVFRDNKHIGYLQSRKGEKIVVLIDSFSFLTMDEIKMILITANP